jgi:hypothetical protein
MMGCLLQITMEIQAHDLLLRALDDLVRRRHGKGRMGLIHQHARMRCSVRRESCTKL